MSVLDHPDIFHLDSLGIAAATAQAPSVFAEARARAEAVDIPFPADAVHNVAICGMGGSAIAGDLVVGAYAERLRKPVQVVRDYVLPGWVGENTLVIGSSFSGTTEETLTCMMEALDRTCPAVAISTGGKLVDFYGERGVPVVTPPGAPMPRAALVQMLGALLVVLERMDVLPSLDADFAETAEALPALVRDYGPSTPANENTAKQVANLLLERLPLIWGAQATAPVAYRWKCQINENAKIPAYWATLPEHNHNEICGVEGSGASGSRTRAVILRDPRHHRQIERRIDVTHALVDPFIDGVTPIMADGETTLAKMLDLVLLGDYVSLYLAALGQVDPGPITMIDRLKERLANTGYGRSPDPSAP